MGDSDGDLCDDFMNPGDMVDYPFQRVIVSCTDEDGDGLLDFSDAALLSQNTGEFLYIYIVPPSL